MVIYSLDVNKLEFPDPNLASSDPDGLLAMGGDLSTERLLLAYQNGIFPWFNQNEPILWWSPDPRAVLMPNEFYINRTFAKILKNTIFKFKIDTDFNAVIKQCAAPRNADHGTWLSSEMQHAYIKLHQAGFAHSYECWRDSELIGGLYGVRLGKVFFAESMFRKVNNASKMAVYFLCQEMIKTNGTMIDIQIISPHLKSWGAKEILRSEFLSRLRN